MNIRAVAVFVAVATAAAASVVLWSMQDRIESNPDISDERAELPEDSSSGLNVTDAIGNDRNAGSPNNLANKIRRVRKNAANNTGLSQEELQQFQEFAAAVFYDPTTSPQLLGDLHAALADTYGQDEADFLSAILIMTDWEEIRAALLERGQTTGHDYSDLYARAGLAHGDISVADLTTLAQNGPGLPTDTINLLARSGRIDAIRELANSGVLVDLDFRDPVSGENAIATYVRSTGYFPNKYDPQDAAAALEQLITLGVPTSFKDGSIDPLDYALQVNPSNADLKYAMAKVLIEHGVEIQESHIQLVARMGNNELKRQFTELIDTSP